MHLYRKMSRLPGKVILILLIFLAGISILTAQNGLTINGLNQASYVYRAVPDSLHNYFYDSFAFNLVYRDFSFGMKFIAELPKYSIEQSELLAELNPDRLNLGWKELYASYNRNNYQVYAGTMEETFGSGLIFRSYQDLEMDEDYRVNGFRFVYDNKLRVKALYSAYNNPINRGKLDLACGADLQYPVLQDLTLGVSVLSLQSFIGSSYKEDNIFGGRASFQEDWMDASLELAQRFKEYSNDDGTAIYGNLSTYFGPLQIGGAYKYYEDFDYFNHLQDIPLANYHNETLVDSQSSGLDEEGLQGWMSFAFLKYWTFNLDYAEAWNHNRKVKMNDFFVSLDWNKDLTTASISYSQIEKIDEIYSHWQKESYPGFNLQLIGKKNPLTLSGEFKIVEKQVYDVVTSHYEPKFQLDTSFNKLSCSLALQSWWKDLSHLTQSRYMPSVQLKYPLFPETDILLFVGKEAGGKVCRNGICRYVAPFSGLKFEINTRF